MMIEISSSGGIGGVAARLNTNKQINISEQDTELQDAYCAAFDPERLRVLTESEFAPGAGDVVNYRISVTDDADIRHIFELREDQLPPELLDLIDGI